MCRSNCSSLRNCLPQIYVARSSRLYEARGKSASRVSGDPLDLRQRRNTCAASAAAPHCRFVTPSVIACPGRRLCVSAEDSAREGVSFGAGVAAEVGTCSGVKRMTGLAVVFCATETKGNCVAVATNGAGVAAGGGVGRGMCRRVGRIGIIGIIGSIVDSIIRSSIRHTIRLQRRRRDEDSELVALARVVDAGGGIEVLRLTLPAPLPCGSTDYSRSASRYQSSSPMQGPECNYVPAVHQSHLSESVS